MTPDRFAIIQSVPDPVDTSESRPISPAPYAAAQLTWAARYVVKLVSAMKTMMKSSENHAVVMFHVAGELPSVWCLSRYRGHVPYFMQAELAPNTQSEH